MEAWGSYACDCPDLYGGKDCSQNIEASRKLKGTSYLQYDMYTSARRVQLPWYNGISFRTRQKSTALLMSIEFDRNERINIEVG